MNHMVVVAFFFALTSSVAAYSSESVESLQQKRTAYQLGIKENKGSIKTLSRRLEGYQLKKNDAQNKLAESEKEFELAKQNLERSTLGGNYSQVVLEQIQQRYVIIETGYLAKKARMERVDRKLKMIKQEMDNLLVSNNLSEKIVKELAEKIELRKQFDEVERRRYTIEQQAAALAEARENLAASQKRESSASSAADAKPTNEIILTPEQRRARREMDRLNRIASLFDKTESRHYLELLLEIDGQRVEELEYWGGDQFYSEIDLSSGKHVLTLNSYDFKVNIPEEESDEVFVVIYTSNGKQRGRFVYFNKSLLVGASPH